MRSWSGKFVASCVALFLTGGGAPAPAAPMVFFGLDNSDLSGGGASPVSDAAQALFAAAAGSLAMQDFESLSLGPVPASFAIGGVTATFSSAATGYSVIASGVNAAYSTFATGGSRYLDSLSGNGSAYYTIAFDRPVAALAFYVSDISDWAGSPGPIPNLQINLTQVSGGTSLDLANGVDATTIVNGSVSFFGVVDFANPITAFSISSPVGIPDADAIGLDDLQVAAVPEPSQTLLMIVGILALIAYEVARRRSRAPSPRRLPLTGR